MKWNQEDMDMYLKAREYVDTIVLPLFPVSFAEKMKQSAGMSEFVQLLSLQLERKFKGRLLLLPGFIYAKTAGENEDVVGANLLKWEKEFFENGFKYVYYLTSDIDCKKVENVIQGSLIWLPSLPLAQMDERTRNTVFEDQVAQLVEIFVQKWKAAE
ncbi:YpiF family protein [Bacillus benzoevorans]|uniref:DUF2487 family protein n=1 Tax=Bacillus benzoevorans TaxID=1456 RepID=A0A7X0HPP4_9BACI|nr:YpiF family protein [Bacillus benzoevorans]MBB6444690.1 hypothetical protein [Bacillus benzoevorans]